ncbi:MAG TPA: amino acid ABC transporter substrate-binding protein [Acidimicrobiia bacterium]|jgi:branched-chain amino acid transport system substrate-binding protein|nr:amino acid ABC transporter substrate-binding protein [Acidimicrobiia bacterium]
MKKRWRWVSLLAVLALLVAACAGDGATTTTGDGGADTTEAPTATTGGGTDTTGGGDAEGEIVFAASVPLTGEFSIPGTKHRDGYQLCLDMINERGGLLGRQTRLIVEDNRSDTEVAVQQYERFINVDQVDALLGTFSSLISFPTSAVAEQAGYVYPVASGGAQRIWERGYEYLFYFQQQTAEGLGESVFLALDHYVDEGLIAEEDKPQTVAMAYADDFFAAAIINGMVGGEIEIPDTGEKISLAPGYLETYGYEAVFEEQWPVGFTDWLTLANSIAAADADMLVVTTASPDEAIALVSALQTVGYQPDVAFFSQGTQREFYDALGDATNGTLIYSAYHLDANWEGELLGEPFTNSDFIEAWNAEFGRDPDEDEAIPFAVCQGMTQAIEATGGTDQTAMRDWLASRTEEEPVRTILGDFYWDERGLPIDRSPILTQWDNGTLNFVYPVDEFEGTTDMIFPKPEW